MTPPGWEGWEPSERATLLFVIRDGHILLIRKKRGLGAGKINGPGGRIEPGETAQEAAVRETREELGITPIGPELRGELHFQFMDGYRLHCSVFAASDFLGEPVETPEAAPLWTPLNAIPFDQMWADDVYWLPGLIAGRRFRAWFVFDGDHMLERHVHWLDEEERPLRPKRQRRVFCSPRGKRQGASSSRSAIKKFFWGTPSLSGRATFAFAGLRLGVS